MVGELWAKGSCMLRRLKENYRIRFIFISWRLPSSSTFQHLLSYVIIFFAAVATILSSMAILLHFVIPQVISFSCPRCLIYNCQEDVCLYLSCIIVPKRCLSVYTCLNVYPISTSLPSWAATGCLPTTYYLWLDLELMSPLMKTSMLMLLSGYCLGCQEILELFLLFPLDKTLKNICPVSPTL